MIQFGRPFTVRRESGKGAEVCSAGAKCCLECFYRMVCGRQEGVKSEISEISHNLVWSWRQLLQPRALLLLVEDQEVFLGKTVAALIT